MNDPLYKPSDFDGIIRGETKYLVQSSLGHESLGAMVYGSIADRANEIHGLRCLANLSIKTAQTFVENEKLRAEVEKLKYALERIAAIKPPLVLGDAASIYRMARQALGLGDEK